MSVNDREQCRHQGCTKFLTAAESKTSGYCAEHDRNGRHKSKIARMGLKTFMDTYERSRSDQEIAVKLEVHTQTIINWRDKLGLPAKGGSL